MPLENDKLFIYSDYEVAVVCNGISGRSVRTVIETNKFACRWQPCCILVLLHRSLFFKTVNRQQQKNKRTTSYILLRQTYQVNARTCDFLTRTFFLFAIACVLFFPFSVNVYASSNVILQGTGSILIRFNFDYFLYKCALFIHLPSSISEVA